MLSTPLKKFAAVFGNWGRFICGEFCCFQKAEVVFRFQIDSLEKKVCLVCQGIFDIKKSAPRRDGHIIFRNHPVSPLKQVRFCNVPIYAAPVTGGGRGSLL